ncbi:MAG: PEP-CTERM sorting domain-containing protein [Verrucomicrobiaceae bacterium]|nr:PEP-CTERM sorting domain-containing protein [Verrucomicrobiaceae bacterium]
MRLLALLASLALLSTTASKGAVAAGGMAIIGYDDLFDSFTLVALDEISAGEVLYFTDSGWVSGLDVFRSGSPTATNQLDGESLLKLNVTGTISAGTVISSFSDGAAWNWVNSGAIDGVNPANGEFSDLRLNETFTGPYEPPADQIYIFQASNGANPIGTPTNFVYLLDNPISGYTGFENSSDNYTGNIAPGLSTGANTAFEHTIYTFHDGAFGLDLSGIAFTSLNSVGGTKEEWLALIADSTNWTTDEPSTAATFNVTFGLAPEPTRGILVLAGVILAVTRRKRSLA